MQKSKESEDAVDRSITCWVIQSSSNKDVLDSLQEFHCEEKENTTGELSVASSSINPPCSEKAKGCKARRHLPSETHFKYQQMLKCKSNK
mmetsp:Transcript_21650/g.31511  ORF Transcript_21650/g.31511 Transcript_21650/m.31511 type:complete len:90 (-) Transcript_21650:25-294(-)